MSKLNSSKLLVDVDKDGKAVIDDSGYRASVSNLGWRWDRQHEANYDITVEEVENFTAPDYNDQKVTNLALGKTYKTSWSWNGTTETYEDYCGHTWVAEQDKYVSNYVEGGWNAGELTNGVRVYKAANNFGQGNDYWAGWSFAHTDADNFMIDSKRYFDITIDLGGIYPVYQVNLDQLSRNDGEMGIYNVEKVQLFTSTTDSEDSFKLQRTLKVKNFTPSESNIFRYYLGTDSGAVNAQYVKIRVWQNTDSYKTWFLCSEIEVLGLDGTKAEYVDSVGLNFTYSVDGKTPYNIWDGTDFEGAGYMTHDDGKRLVMYYDGTNYSPNLLSPDNFFKFTKKTDGGSSRDVLSGWSLANGMGDEIPFMLDIDGDASITQVAAHVGNEYAGLVKPRYAKLYMVAADGTETLIPTNLILTSIYDGDVNDDGKMDSSNDNLEGYRYILEIANEGLYVPDDAKLKLCMGREADDGSNAYIFAGIQILGRKGNVYAQSEVVSDLASVKYEFIGDYAEKAGFAQGIITVNPILSETTTGNYLIYYTDDNGVLAGYDEIASIPITGSKVTYEIPDGIMIPEDATGIAVFESANAFEDSAPDISTAIATRAIPTAKRLSLGEADTVFGAVSDVHINRQNYGQPDAIPKWEKALEFFEENEASYIIVSGDMTGDSNNSTDGPLVEQYQNYTDAITGRYTGQIYEALGNHGALPGDLELFYQYTQSGSDPDVHYPAGKTNSPYYYVVKGENVFVFMHLELSGRQTFGVTKRTVNDDITKVSNPLMHNVFATGSHEAGMQKSNELAYGIKTDKQDSDIITNVFYDFGDQVLQGSVGQAASDLDSVVAAFNDRTSSEYNAAMARITLNGEVLDIELCQAAVNGDSIALVNGIN